MDNGAVCPADDLRCTKSFEIKEWDVSLVQNEWQDHAQHGSEYISVKAGVLTAILGHREKNGSFVENKRVAIEQDHAIILADGLWRKFEGTADVQGISVREPPNGQKSDTSLEAYNSVTEHWKHTDQVRQWLLYNYLMGISFLSTAWATLYSATYSPKALTSLLAGIGAVLSIAWIFLARRASSYYDMYEIDGFNLEGSLKLVNWPFHRRRAFRAANRGPGFGHVAQALPAIFAVFFALAFYTSIFR